MATMHVLSSLRMALKVVKPPVFSISHASQRVTGLSRFIQIQQHGIRSFSSNFGGKLTPLLKAGRSNYLFLQKATNQQKVETTIQQALEKMLSVFGQAVMETTTPGAWQQLHAVLKSRSIEFPPFQGYISEDDILTLFRLFPRKLLKGDACTVDFDVSEYVTTPTDLLWFYQRFSFPFTRHQEKIDFDPSRIAYILKQTETPSSLAEPVEQEIQDWIYHSSTEDALGALLLATAHLDRDTIVHEIGTWNGENLFNILYHSYLQKRVIAGCVGTDINIPALNIAEASASILGLAEPLVQFHLANAVKPASLSSLGISYTKEMRIALRVLPLLEPQNGRAFLQAVKDSIKTQNSFLILSYAIPQGKMYEQNSRIASSDPNLVQKEEFSGGSIFRTPFPEKLPPNMQSSRRHNTVLNTYYTVDGFNTLAKECGFKIVHTVMVGEYSDNDRAVVLLKPL